jgi:hypothetical protein
MARNHPRARPGTILIQINAPSGRSGEHERDVQEKVYEPES